MDSFSEDRNHKATLPDSAPSRRSVLTAAPAWMVAGSLPAGIAAALAGAPVLAQSAAAGSGGVAQPDFAALSARLLPAVVGIGVGRAPAGLPDDAAHRGMLQQSSSGSGFVVDASGVVVTNNHVVEGANRFQVSFQNGALLDATLVGRDPETDLAVLRVRAPRPLTWVRWGDSSAVQVGQWAIAIGSPFGLGNSVSVGVISGRNRDLQSGRFDDFLQTDAAINRGNSGGPLFNARGEVIGVNTAIVSPGGAAGGSVGVGFAVPSNLARQVVQDLSTLGYVRRGFIGLRSRPATPQEGSGVVVVEVLPGSPAEAGGLRPGDRLVSWAGRAITDPRDLAREVAGARPGTRVRIMGVRAPRGGNIYADLTVAQAPTEARAQSTGPVDAASVAVGLTLRAVRRPPQGRDDVPSTVRVIVSAVDPFGPARRQVEPGDGLLEVQGRAVADPSSARAALEEAARNRDAIVLRLWRDGEPIIRAVRPRR